MIQGKTVELKNRLVDLVKQNTPIRANGKELTIEDLHFDEPSAINNVEEQLKMKYLGDKELSEGKGNLMGWLRGKIIIRDDKGKVLSQSRDLNLIPVPYLTDRGTYIMNGSEKSILSQMRLKPGAYTTVGLDKDEIKTNFMFDNSYKGGRYVPQIVVTFNPADFDFNVTVKSKPPVVFNGINFLREIGFNDTEIARMIGNNNISDIIFKKYGNRNAKSITQLYKAITGTNTNETPEKARLTLFEYLNTNASFGPTGADVVKHTLGTNSMTMTKDVIAKSMQKTFAVARKDVPEDDKDDLRFKDVYDDNDFIVEEADKDFNTFKEKALEILNSKTGKGVKYTDFRGAVKLDTGINRFFAKSSLIQTPDQTNPLFMAGMGKKITQLGDGGMSSDASRNEKRARNLASMSLNRIDPIETPESGNIGLIGHLTQSATIKDRTIHTTVLKVKDGIAEDTNANTVELSPHKEYDTKVAFYDTRYVEREGSKISFKEGVLAVPGRYKGKIQSIPTDEIQYIDKAPQNLMSYAANMIPFVSHNDGNRAMMGSNMQKQAIILKNREVPLVSTATDPTKTMTNEEFIGANFARPITAIADGVVHKIEDNKIIVKDKEGVEHEHQIHSYFPLNHGFVNNQVTVQQGQEIKKGQLMAEGWHTKDGKLALGVNTRIGYVPYKGYNYEDGVVISQSFAKRMATEEMEEVEKDIDADWLGGRGSNVMEQLKSYTNVASLGSLDTDGIIKVGEHVKPGSTLAAILKPVKEEDDFGLANLLGNAKSKVNYRFESLTIPPTSYVEGIVKRVQIISHPEADIKQRIVVTLLTSNPLKLR